MRILITHFLVLIFLSPLKAQDWNWAERFGGMESDAVASMKIDANGDIVIGGSYRGIVDLGSANLEALQGSDAFLSKLNDEGEVLWALSGGSLNNDVSIDVEIDEDGNIIWLGQFWISAFFEGDTIQAGSNSKAYFVAKYSSTGDLIWVESIGGSATKVVNDLTVNEEGDIYLTGYFNDSLIVDDVVLVTENEGDGFLMKMTTNGEALWGKQYGESGDVRLNKIEMTSGNQLVVAGDIIGSVAFGNDTLISVTTAFDMFVGLLDGDGIGQWGRIGTGVFNNLLSAIELDEADNIYLTGGYIGVLGIGGEELTTPGFQDNLYLIKLDVQGNVIWARGLVAETFNDPSYAFDLTIKDNLVMMIGQFEGLLQIDDLSVNGGGQTSAFIAGFNAVDGVVDLLSKISGTGQVLGFQIAVDANDLIHIAGLFLGEVGFDDSMLVASGGIDFYIAQANELFTGVEDLFGKKKSLGLYPNPVDEILYVETGNELFELEIFDTFGRLLLYFENQKELDVGSLNSGMYFVRYRDGGFFKILSFIKK